jgi:hypothetical protein
VRELREACCGDAPWQSAVDFFIMARNRLMTSAARMPLLIMASTELRPLPRLGGSQASQRKQALPWVTNAVSGWLISWAIAAVSSPSVVTRATCARSARANEFELIRLISDRVSDDMDMFD